MIANPKPPKPIRDAKHLENIRQCCCVICGTTENVEAHHLLRTPEKAMGRRSGDDKAVPLCGASRNHHRGPDSPHMAGNETDWFEAHGHYYPDAIAWTFWLARDEPSRMQAYAKQMAEVARRAGR